jgi:hypothetical protein
MAESGCLEQVNRGADNPTSYYKNYHETRKEGQGLVWAVAPLIIRNPISINFVSYNSFQPMSKNSKPCYSFQSLCKNLYSHQDFNYNARELIHNEVFTTGFEAFTVTDFSEVFLGDKPCENIVKYPVFCRLSPDHQILTPSSLC